MRGVWQDFRYGLQMLVKSPGFTASAVFSLALGIGVNTTIFSFVNALLLKPLPIADSNRLVAVYTSDFSGPPLGTSSYPDYIDFRDGSDVFSGMAAYSMEPMSLSGPDGAQRMLGHIVTGDYFSVLGVEAARGRVFSSEDERVVVLSHGLWQRRFGSDPLVVGREIVLNGQPFRVGGVAPRSFTGLTRGIPADVWTPLATHGGQREVNRRAQRGARWLFVAGRLRDGVSLEQAQAAFGVIATQLHATYPEQWTDVREEGRRVTLVPANDALMVSRSGVVGFLTLLMAVVGIVLLLACVNVANLMLARSVARAREMSIRLSLGAGRARLIRQLLTESVLLSAVAGGAGLMVAIWTTGLLMRFRPPLPLPVEFDLGLDMRVLGFAIALSAVTALLSGLLPAIRTTRVSLAGALKEANPEARGGGAGFFNLRNTLAAVQVALSALLLIGAGLFVRSLARASALDVGFDPNNMAVASMDLGLQGYEEARGKALSEPAGAD